MVLADAPTNPPTTPEKPAPVPPKAPTPAAPAAAAAPPKPAEPPLPPIDMSDVDALKVLVADAVTETGRQTDKPVAVIATPRILDVLRQARDELKFDHLANYTTVDYPLKKTIEVIYNLYSYPKKKHLVLKVRLPRDDPTVASLTPLWAGANWDEREMFDLMGVRFEGHPDLKRLFLPSNWKGHPLRKDYPLQEEQWIGMNEKGEDVAYSTPGEGRY